MICTSASPAARRGDADALRRKYPMMNHTMGWVGGGMWLWGAVCILFVVLLVRLIATLSKK